ncbi:hypothetical protein [Kitasatospora aureofaciens]|uniref:hypothetical protein n=1 Tax=Kitasatospora aureofaciens TaxID=1894 RepID=UPI001C44D54B|nr:hypothetical protein [Kitasatospora aureofaciens]MBV6697896.1 hypothetical protein [Kitasatospora aureofaciens]
MLNTGKPARRFAILAPLSAGLLLTSAISAIADETPGGGAEQCEPVAICGEVHGGGGKPTGGGGGGGGGGGSSEGPLLCSYHGQEYPCHDPEMGWFSNSDGCYYTTVDKPDDPAWEGHKPSEGALYLPSCPNGAGGWSPGDIKFHAVAPAAPPPDPRAMALQILKDRMAFPAPAPAAAPLGTAVVKSPVWLWVKGYQPPQPVSLTLQGVTVTVTPRLKNVVWNFSDKYSVTCDKPGTPYDDKYGDAKSPDCGFEFPTGSAGEPGGAFSVNATANWVGEVTVTGLNTKKFEIGMPQNAGFQLKVAEVQVLN